MMDRRTFLGAMAATLLPVGSEAATREAKFFEDRLLAGSLDPVQMRLPRHPRVINLAAMGRQPGVYGGTVRSIIGSQKDIRLMTINGYARLVGYDENLALQPDILESFESIEDRVFTFKIREGHRWSDGSLLTSEDFRYTWQDVYMDKDLKRGGLPRELLVDGEGPGFEVLDAYTVRYTWKLPNPDFLPRIAGPQPLVMVMPAAYMKQFHKRYQDEFRLSSLMKEYKAKKWVDLHIKMSRSYRPENPDLPTLDPWRNTTAPPSEQFVFERNPYFHRVDENGLQLPYIDRMILSVSANDIIAAKTGAGEADLQFRGLDFTDYAFMKDAEKRYPVKVSLWKRTTGSQVALLPNLNTADPAWQALMRDVRFRRALSLSIDRTEINKVVFYGLAAESADTVLPESPLFRPELKTAWATFDPAGANKLLDEIGLTGRDDDGLRLLPDGRPLQIVVETSGESTLETDLLELITDHWREIGVSLFIKTSQRDVFRSRAISGTIMMSVWSGLDNGVPTPDMNPGQLAPTSDEQLQWPLWGSYYLSNGMEGKPPEIPEAQKLVDLLGQWRHASATEERRRIWDEMLSIYSDQVFSIGIVNSALQPMMRSSRLRNMPDKGLFGFDPTCYLGVYMPDTFWYQEEA
ncbi:peptide/nickel transport system substrate-binding protein [Rhizobium sp. SG_E_25_P2]|uniref:ABC transporter substrate-binding protein n=1 Tax=Rhizobium sp. SG_E_25_P2 TaxID=2879942 RepID=UPI00247372EC|nr:ABC transporter substrate-binding protein [Rhizobium sp. SG_E_25_P2]MDH6266327.1 peptide/nickel transport system substrate-binding protein [Rhizobium sp. SG_E_25_P2]